MARSRAPCEPVDGGVLGADDCRRRRRIDGDGLATKGLTRRLSLRYRRVGADRDGSGDAQLSRDDGGGRKWWRRVDDVGESQLNRASRRRRRAAKFDEGATGGDKPEAGAGGGGAGG